MRDKTPAQKQVLKAKSILSAWNADRPLPYIFIIAG
jgi:hypothetical protein